MNTQTPTQPDEKKTITVPANFLTAVEDLLAVQRRYMTAQPKTQSILMEFNRKQAIVRQMVNKVRGEQKALEAHAQYAQTAFTTEG
jgi:hypothetical protein